MGNCQGSARAAETPEPPTNRGRVFVSSDGRRRLYFETYASTAPERASLIYLHGLHESLNITALARLVPALAAVGISTAAFEQHGHGRSTGLHGHLVHLDAVLADTSQFIRARVAALPAGVPFALCGHSMGGALAIVLGNLLRAEFGDRFLGAALLSPFVRLHARDRIGAFDSAVLALAAAPLCVGALGAASLGPEIVTASDFGADNKAEIARYDGAQLLLLQAGNPTLDPGAEGPAVTATPPIRRNANYSGHMRLATGGRVPLRPLR